MTSPKVGSSPHTRGAHPGGGLRLWGVGIIPAYAGSTTGRRDDARRDQDHPRIRGEHALDVQAGLTRGGSSPHTRGAPPLVAGPLAPMRIIPAYAGSTDYIKNAPEGLEDHPRIRGEHVVPIPGETLACGSSPHTRGARSLRRSSFPDIRIIPAYAGSTAILFGLSCDDGDHPRIRGEHSPTRRQRPPPAGSSPHTRGARGVTCRLAVSARIIPAYAGSTSTYGFWLMRKEDHPRIRGEHDFWNHCRPQSVGSSPHTRGAHLEIPAIPRIAAVIIPVFLYPSPTPQEEADRSMVLLTLS